MAKAKIVDVAAELEPFRPKRKTWIERMEPDLRERLIQARQLHKADPLKYSATTIHRWLKEHGVKVSTDTLHPWLRDDG